MEETVAGDELIRKKSGGSVAAIAEASYSASSNAALPKYAGSASAIVNVYHDGDALKMFDIVEFFGVLAVASLDSTLIGDCDDDGFTIAPPPASAVPRFHAITYRRMKTPHPLTSGCLCPGVSHVPAADVPSLSAAARSSFVAALSAALSCDADCATQVLLCIMSNIQDRVSGEAIGTYSLNLRLPPSSTVAPVHSRCCSFFFRVFFNVTCFTYIFRVFFCVFCFGLLLRLLFYFVLFYSCKVSSLTTIAAARCSQMESRAALAVMLSSIVCGSSYVPCFRQGVASLFLFPR